MNLRRIASALVAVSGALLVAASIAPLRAASHEVDIAGFAFTPAELTITAGDTVTWTNADAMVHTVTGVDGSFDSGDLAQAESYSLTFTTPGTYDYLCTPHPSMTGRVVVLAAAPSSPSPDLPNVAMSRGGADLRLVAAGMLLLGAGVALGLRRARQRSSRFDDT